VLWRWPSIDDLIGLNLILGVVTGIATGGEVSAWSVARLSGLAIGFVAVALAAGSMPCPPSFRVVERLRTTGALGLIALAFALLLAWLRRRQRIGDDRGGARGRVGAPSHATTPRDRAEL